MTMGASRAALILAGAVAKGAYAAGVLTRLAKDERAEIVAVAGSSAGALNGAVYAAGLRAERAEDAAALLERLWVEEASWRKIYAWEKRKRLLLTALEQFQRLPRRREVRFRAVVATLPGRLDRFGRRRFEESETFEAADFENSARLEHMAELCVASAAFPVVFPPRRVGGRGPFWDGGIVDNAPIGWALKDREGKDSHIDHIIVATPDSNVIGSRRYSRFSVGRLFEMLVDERLARDLYEAESFNAELRKLDMTLDALQGPGSAEPGAVRWAEDVRREMNWRTLQFLEIRPRRDLAGNPLSGFGSQRLRREYVLAGHEAADRELRAWQPALARQAEAAWVGARPRPGAPPAQPAANS